MMERNNEFGEIFRGFCEKMYGILQTDCSREDESQEQGGERQ